MSATCRHGHAMVPDNTYVEPSGKVRCKTCRAEASRRHYLSKVHRNQLQFKFSTEPLHARINLMVKDGLTHDEIAFRYGVSRDVLRKILCTKKISQRTADMWACRFRAHPSELWDEWEEWVA